MLAKATGNVVKPHHNVQLSEACQRVEHAMKCRQLVVVQMPEPAAAATAIDGRDDLVTICYGGPVHCQQPRIHITPQLTAWLGMSTSRTHRLEVTPAGCNQGTCEVQQHQQPSTGTVIRDGGTVQCQLPRLPTTPQRTAR